MVIFSAWIKERLEPLRLRFGSRGRRNSPTEESPLQGNYIPPPMDFQLPGSSVLLNESETVPMTTFSQNRPSNRNSLLTVEENVSEDEETPFVSSSLGARPKKLTPVSAPQVPAEASSEKEPGSFIWKDTFKLVKAKYDQFVSKKVESHSSSDSEDDCIDLLVAYEPKLPFLISTNEKQRKVFEELALAQKALYTLESNLAFNVRRVDGLNAEYEVLRSQENPDFDRMDECLKSNLNLHFGF